jgi:hypothetical protein
MITVLRHHDQPEDQVLLEITLETANLLVKSCASPFLVVLNTD